MLHFTTSWDDGSVLDIKVADILSRYGMKGTFYIPGEFDGHGGKFSAYNRRLSEDEIRLVASRHEVGGHSLTHRILTGLSSGEAKVEIEGSQELLSGILGSGVKMFSFPKGKFSDDLVATAQEAGFVGARSTKKQAINNRGRQFVMDVTTICQPYPFRKLDANHYYWRRILDPLKAYDPIILAPSWQALARKLFKEAYNNGDYFHLYGHSWELEKYGMWEELGSFLEFVRGHESVRYCTNGEIAEL